MLFMHPIPDRMTEPFSVNPVHFAVLVELVNQQAAEIANLRQEVVVTTLQQAQLGMAAGARGPQPAV